MRNKKYWIVPVLIVALLFAFLLARSKYERAHPTLPALSGESPCLS